MCRARGQQRARAGRVRWLRVAGAEIDLREQAVLLAHQAAQHRDSPAALGLAERTGEGNAYWMGFGPTNTGFWRMNVALEAGDYQRAVTIAEGLHPEAHPFRGCQAMYWVDYGRALARLRRRHDDAVKAIRQAERISPLRVHRNPYAREVLGHLLSRARRDAVGRELRGMAYRAGLLVSPPE